MNRPVYVWCLFGASLLAAIFAVGWLTQSAWQADQARQQALLDSQVRNALWRLDSFAAPLLAVEMNRPSLTGDVRGPMLAPQLVKGYVVQMATGQWRIRDQHEAKLRFVKPTETPLIRQDWVALFQRESDSAGSATVATTDHPGKHSDELVIWPEDSPVETSGPISQSVVARSSNPESQIRNQLLQQVQQFAVNSQQQVPHDGQEPIPRFTALQPIWIQDELVLARKGVTNAGGPEAAVIELCWLNWPAWKVLLTSQLEGLSISLRLVPCPMSTNERTSDDWQMVSLPIRLESVSQANAGTWPYPLIAVWGLLLLVALAFAWLMQQSLNLSERRAAFVSAVTHELRTPLTTFRLYTEMLSEGLATDPDKQHSYYQILHREANRLTHLVENVLAYARLENGRSTAQNETLSVSELIDRCCVRLQQRVAETRLTLNVQICDAASSAVLTTNALAVDQILFNLVDNSCKYARDAVDPRILCSVELERSHVRIRMSDFGPGLSPIARWNLFQPFQKSSSQAAETALGVGLGLALSQRLARDLRGSLRCVSNPPAGVSFELRLPVKSRAAGTS